MSRAYDLVAVAAVALVLLLTRTSLRAKPALEADRIELDRVAQLEDARFAAPDDIDRALALADAYLQLEHADWALATLDGFTARGDHRVHLRRATAFASRLEAAAAVAEAARGQAACAGEGPARCPPVERVRLGVIAAPMQALVDGNIDPTKDPVRARAAVREVLHQTKANDAQFSAPGKKPATP